MKVLVRALPGFLSWGFLIFLFLSIFWNPAISAVIIISFNLYWLLRMSYLTVLLLMGHMKLHAEERWDWLEKAQSVKSQYGSYADIYHAVLFPVYKEPYETMEASIHAVAVSRYDLKKIVIVIAVEERGGAPVYESALRLKAKYEDIFKALIISVHPDGLPGEERVKGANASWAAQALERWVKQEGISKDHVILSCFDADTVCGRQYFACLTHAFLTHPDPHQASFQPIPVYHNNIWHAPSFARVVEISSSFWQFVQSMRRDRLVTFSSHSMSFKTLCDIDFWPRDMVSDDSAIYWRALLHFDGDYHVVPIHVTVSMDVAFDKGFLKTIINQYKQKRRWAWGIENFAMFVEGITKPNRMPFAQKVKKIFQLLEEHFTWATWAVVLVFVSPLPVLLGGIAFQNSVIGYNLTMITRILLGITSLSMAVCIIVSFSMLPPKPKDVPSYRLLTMCTQWLFIPFVSAFIGSLPALDAQTRFMIGQKLPFWVTPKKRFAKSKAPNA